MILRPSHLPTWLLIIGYPLFWVEMQFHSGAHTSLAATVIFILVSLAALRQTTWPFQFKKPQIPKGGFAFWCFAGSIILLISLGAALLPPHLGQEYDALNYHYAIPRQHLLRGNFDFIPWATLDLCLLPIQYALSPYWFATSLPNKFPQYLFLLGLLGVTYSLAKHLSLRENAGWVAIACILGSHGLAIQFGTAMLDIPIAYLGIAAIDSILRKEWVLGGIESAFFFWSKSFMPIQAGILLVCLGTVIGAAVLLAWTRKVNLDPQWRWFALSFLLCGFLIAGPQIAKSWRVSGTPLYPIAAFRFHDSLTTPADKSALQEAAKRLWTSKDAYGEGRNVRSFIRHFWKLALPDKGVNNSFDYPLGLPYLLVLIPFIVSFFQSLYRKQLRLIPWTIVALWSIWWMGSQQSRWLYFPLVLLFIITVVEHPIADSSMFRSGLSLSLMLVAVSLWRAHGPDLRAWPVMPVRPQDQAILEMTRGVSGFVDVPRREVAFAEAPVMVTQPDGVWVLPLKP